MNIIFNKYKKRCYKIKKIRNSKIYFEFTYLKLNMEPFIVNLIKNFLYKN